MSIARLVLDYLEALKWPIVAVIAIRIFRKPISELIGRIRTMKATVGGSSIELDAARRGLEKAAEKATEPPEEIFAEGAGGRPSPGGLETRGDEARAGRPGATPEEYAAAGAARGRPSRPELRERLVQVVERQRQRDIEAVIRAAVDYGWLTALKEPNGPRPYPVIEWTEDGKPHITTFTTTETGDARHGATEPPSR